MFLSLGRGWRSTRVSSSFSTRAWSGRTMLLLRDAIVARMDFLSACGWRKEDFTVRLGSCLVVAPPGGGFSRSFVGQDVVIFMQHYVIHKCFPSSPPQSQVRCLLLKSARERFETTGAGSTSSFERFFDRERGGLPGPHFLSGRRAMQGERDNLSPNFRTSGTGQGIRVVCW